MRWTPDSAPSGCEPGGGGGRVETTRAIVVVRTVGPLQRPLDARVRVPGSKYEANRLLVAAALAPEGALSQVEGLPAGGERGADLSAALGALRALGGLTGASEAGVATVRGLAATAPATRDTAPPETVDVGESGTLFRFLAAAGATLPFRIRIVGRGRLSQAAHPRTGDRARQPRRPDRARGSGAKRPSAGRRNARSRWRSGCPSRPGNESVRERTAPRGPANARRPGHRDGLGAGLVLLPRPHRLGHGAARRSGRASGAPRASRASRATVCGGALPGFGRLEHRLVLPRGGGDRTRAGSGRGARSRVAAGRAALFRTASTHGMPGRGVRRGRRLRGDRGGAPTASRHRRRSFGDARRGADARRGRAIRGGDPRASTASAICATRRATGSRRLRPASRRSECAPRPVPST